MVNYENCIKTIQEDAERYLASNNLKAVIIGISGGLDSGLNAALLQPVCKKLNVPLIGRYLFMEGNSPEETERANKIGTNFCSEYQSVNLNDLYQYSLKTFDNEFQLSINSIGIKDKIRRGNIKARLRMIYLYNLAQEKCGLVIDNDNKTEHLLGFWTINGDVGDFTPLSDLFKTEVYELANTYLSLLDSNSKKDALQSVIDATPTDGLGITESDYAQFGVNSYEDVDYILQKYTEAESSPLIYAVPTCMAELQKKYEPSQVEGIVNRYINSKFKRQWPYKIRLYL